MRRAECGNQSTGCLVSIGPSSRRMLAQGEATAPHLMHAAEDEQLLQLGESARRTRALQVASLRVNLERVLYDSENGGISVSRIRPPLDSQAIWLAAVRIPHPPQFA